MLNDLLYYNDMTDVTYIYELSKNDVPFYVGKTINPKMRLNHHKIKYNGAVMTVIDSVKSTDHKVWKPLESMWIEHYIDQGFTLTNKNNGGQGASKYTPEQCDKMKKKKTGNFWRGGTLSHWHTPEVIAKRRANTDYVAIFDKIKKPINQYDLDGNFIKEWSSQKEASKALNIQSRQLNEVLKLKKESTKGFIFRYK
jgi:hypothetical protein